MSIILSPIFFLNVGKKFIIFRKGGGGVPLCGIFRKID